MDPRGAPPFHVNGRGQLGDTGVNIYDAWHESGVIAGYSSIGACGATDVPSYPCPNMFRKRPGSPVGPLHNHFYGKHGDFIEVQHSFSGSLHSPGRVCYGLTALCRYAVARAKSGQYWKGKMTFQRSLPRPDIMQTGTQRSTEVFHPPHESSATLSASGGIDLVTGSFGRKGVPRVACTTLSRGHVWPVALF